MAVPSKLDPIWSQLVSGKKQLEFESLAVKIVFGRVRNEIVRNPASGPQLASQLYDVFAANETLPSVRKDLLKLFV